MSALEQLPLDSRNRRAAERLLVGDPVAVIFGRGTGVLVDVSRHGARLRHSAPVRRGATVRVSFEWESVRFAATAEVLSSRLVSVGAGPSYESRVRFTSFDPGSERVLGRALDGIAGRDMRRWVANLKGWSEDPQRDRVSAPAGSFLRCKLHGSWWERKLTGDSTQPEEGFVLPPGSTEAEIAMLCDTYFRGGDEERQLIRLMATAAVEQSLATS